MISTQLRKARPTLHTLAPLTNAICWGYGAINILIGFGMYLLYHTPVPLAVASIFTYQAWGVIFLALGLSGTFGLLTNRHMLVKHTLLAGLVVKALWAIALIIGCFAAPQTILITLVWLLFAYIQAVTYVYFLPAISESHE